MLDVTTELKDLYKTDYLPYRSEPVQKDLKFTFTDPVLVIENDKIVAGSFDLQESLNSNEDLVFGSCEAATLKVKFADITEDINGKTFILTQTVEGSVIDLGIFTVDSAIEQDNRRFLEVTAYDNMRKFDRDVVEWYESLTFPTHLKAMRESLCNYCGVEYEDSNLPNDTMSVTKTISSNTLNGLEVLRSLEQLNGAFGHIGRNGKLQHKVLSKTVVDDTIPSGSYKTLKYEKYSTKPIDKLQILSEDGDIGAIVGTGNNCYQIQSNFLVYGKSASALQTIAENAATNILGITYVPYTCDMLGLPYLEAGDRVSFGTAITSYILTRNIKGIQAITDSIETKGNEEIVQVKSINTEVKQLRGKTNVLTRDVEKMESTITEFDEQISVLLPGPWYPDGSLLPCKNNMTNLEYEINSKISQTAKEITTEVNNVSELLSSQINQTATSITAQVNDLTKNMNSQFTQTAAEISTKVEKNGIISSINQSAESITIKADKINLQGYVTATELSTGSLNVSGACLVGTLSAVSITGSTITGSILNTNNGAFSVNSAGALHANTATFGISGGGLLTLDKNGLKTTQSDGSSGTQIYINSVRSQIFLADYAIQVLYDSSWRSVIHEGNIGSQTVGGVNTSYLTMSSGTIVAPGGSLYIGQNTVKANTITQTSSRRYKKEIENYTDSALDIICSSNVKSYRYNSEPSTEEIDGYKAIYEDYDYKKHIGLIVEESNPCIVNQCGDGLDLGAMIAVTWKAIQEFENEYKILIKRVSELEELVCK